MKPLPFPSLRVLEAVARLRGFSRAAEELGMTQSAVSQHVRGLEDWTGRALLRRGARESRATPEGLILAEAVREGLGRIEEALDSLGARDRHARTISVACPPGFAVNWLFPRLLNFDQEHPECPVSITTRADEDVFETAQADMAILYGMDPPPRLHSEHLFGERIFPVCSPALHRQGPGLREAADLAGHTVLEDVHLTRRGAPPTWEFWAEATGATLPAGVRRRRFSQSNLSIQAALQSAGVALGREPLVIDALRAGALVRPLPGVAVSRYHYRIVCPARAMEAEHVRVFRDWLLREAAVPADIGAVATLY
jgi:LysR family glycine cleavage system transcriptional activator